MIKRIANFYFEGFKNMSSTSKRLWIIVLIKLFIMFAILKIFFFPDLLKKNFETDEERGTHVIEHLITN